MWLDMKVRRNSLSCSQYQSDESCVRLRKRASLWRSERKVRAWIAARRTRRASTRESNSVFCTNSYAPAASAASRIPGSSLAVSTMIGQVVAEAMRSSVSRPDESGSHRSARTRSNMLERSSSSASPSVCAAWSTGCPDSPATQRRTSAAKSGSSSRRRTLTVCSTGWNSGAGCMGPPLYPPPGRRSAPTDKPSLSASGDETFWQARAEICNLARPRPPHPRGAGVLDAMPQGGTQAAQAERVAKHVGVDRDTHHQRVALALLDHLVELVDDHVAEVRSVLLAMDDHLRVVELDRIRNREQRPRARAQPHRLVVHRPVHEVFVAELLEEVGRVRCLVGAGSHPPGRRCALVARDGFGDLAQDPLLVGLPQPAQVLGV